MRAESLRVRSFAFVATLAGVLLVGAHDAVAACSATPLAGCRTAERNSLDVRYGPDAAARRLRWSWSRGRPTLAPAFGNPTTITTHIACLYDASGLVLEASVAPGGSCDGRACWAAKVGKGFVPVRKPGKLPWQTHQMEYELEYGTDKVEMHQDGVLPKQRVLMVDDVIATGGTAWAACELVRKLGGTVVGAAFLIELSFLSGRKRIEPVPVSSVIVY